MARLGTASAAGRVAALIAAANRSSSKISSAWFVVAGAGRLRMGRHIR